MPCQACAHGGAVAGAGSDPLRLWGAPKQLPSAVALPKRCPSGGCPGLVVGVKRYGRPANKSLLDLTQMKHLERGRWGVVVHVALA